MKQINFTMVEKVVYFEQAKNSNFVGKERRSRGIAKGITWALGRPASPVTKIIITEANQLSF